MANRIIRFRVWDKFNGCYWHSKEYKNLASFFELCQTAIDGGNTLEFQQFTGLLDKNGKEIYEGDVVEWKDRFPFKISFEYGAFEADEIGQPEASIPRPRWDEVKIIGNIYENPDLLE